MKDAFAALRTLWTAFGRYRYHVLALALFGIASAFLEGIGINTAIPLMSFFTGGASSVTDGITNVLRSVFSFVGVPFTFRYLLGFILILFAIRTVSVVAYGYIQGWIIADFLGKETEDVLRRTLFASWPFMLKQRIGTMQNTLVRDVQQTGSLLGAVAQTIQSFTGFVMYLLIAVNISPTMVLYALGGGAVLLIITRPFLRIARKIGTQSAGTEKQFAQFLSEHILGIKTIKIAGAERAALTDGTAHIHLLRSLSIRKGLVHTFSTSLFQPASIVLVALLFLLTYHTPSFSIISFAASLYLIQKVFTYLESGQNSLQSINEMLPYARNIAHFKHNLAEHRETSGGTAPFVFSNELAFNAVSFSYREGKQVLNHITFGIGRGETVGLVGPSGAGKTSIADLLLRLFTPTSGQVTLDGVGSESIALTEWRKHIGYVSQDVTLLNTSIQENIRFYQSGIAREDIESAAKAANIHDLIMDLPEGYDTKTGDRGVMLSGGQRQRIALARALVRKPSLLILDEATSALDHESEKLIRESIKQLHGTTTVLIIAHRPSTVAEADRILVIREGQIVEEGTPHTLLTNHDSYFAKMQKA